MANVTESGLGKATRYDCDYNPSLLFPIARSDNREKLGAAFKQFIGEDWWTCYELSWLQESGMPAAAIAHFRVPSHSPNIIESKSFKLYLNSLNQHKFKSETELKQILVRDLSQAALAEVEVKIELAHKAQFGITDTSAMVSAVCVDLLRPDARKFVYEPDASLLKLDSEGGQVEELLYSHLLRSNCPVTDQPDWGSVYIEYRGPKIEHESLLRYIISFRQCQDFHEHCVERMFCDILEQCACESLSVYARYTRRGGLDINPYRATKDKTAIAPFIRTVRQ